MLSFAPDPLADFPPLLGEEPNHLEHPQAPGETNLAISEMLRVVVNIMLAILYFVTTQLFRFATRFVPDPLDDTFPPIGEEPNPPDTEQPQDPADTHLSEIQRVAITRITMCLRPGPIDDVRQAVRTTDVALGLQRIPAGFYVTVQADGVEWQTSNKAVHIDLDVLQWNEQILLPCELSSKVRLRVYASLELDPMLGHGEILHTFETSVGELLDRGEKSHPIIFQLKEEEVVSSCTSLSITVAQRHSEENDATVLRPLTTLMTGDMHTLVLRTDAGHCLLARYRRTQNTKDLDQSIKHFERASDLCPVDHRCRPAALFNLAAAKLVSCQANGTCLDLDIPISLFEEALNMRPPRHPDRPVTQLHLAIALLSRFAKRGSQADADAAEESLNEVLDVSPANSHVFRAALLAIETSALTTHTNENTFGTGPIASMLPWSPDELSRQAELCLRRDDPYALDDVISRHHDALEYYSTAHDLRGPLLGNLGTMLLTRFERRGNSQDLDEAIALLRQVLALYSVGHPDRSALLNNLATGLSTRFEQRGNDQDLDEAIMLHREALTLRPVSHPRRFGSLNNLAETFSTRFKYRGNVQDLGEAIALHKEALALLPVGHPHRFASLNNLAGDLSTHFKHQGNGKDLDEAIPLHREALALCSVGHPDRVRVSNNLSSGLFSRFEHRGNDQDLGEAITLQSEALALLPVGHPDRSGTLYNLANQLSARFRHRGNEQDLDEVIALHRETLALRPVSHPDRIGSLNNLAKTLSTHFEHRGSVQDLDEAVALQREALALRPIGHHNRSSPLNNLANQLSTRFRHRGNSQDLDEAILLHKEALALLPFNHSDRSALSNHLANKLSTRFKHQGNGQDLDEAILLCRQTLVLCPVGHPDRSDSLNSLATVLSTCFKHRGNDQDLDEAIPLYREALALRPVGHPDRSDSLNNLATLLYICFEHRGNDQDLDEAVVLQREALTLCPIGHRNRSSSLNSLANQLSACFKHRGNDQSLDEAVVLQREALALCPVGHPDRPMSLNNLATQVFIRFEYRGNDQDLDESILLRREALALHPVSHSDRSTSLSNLANELYTRFDHRGNGQDLDDSLENLRCALTLLTQHDPRQLMVHQSLAAAYLRFHRSRLDGTGEDTDSLDAAMRHLKAATHFVSGGLLGRLRASLHWVRHANQHTHGTELEAYATSMQLLDAYMSATASVSSRHHIMTEFPSTLAADAASCALRLGDVCRAVELLEQGRTLIWTQMARLRTPIDTLQERGDHAQTLMKKFRDLSSLLDKPPPEHQEGTPRVAVEAEATRYRRLVENWNTAVEEIRKLEGFSHFLLPPLFSDLQDAARDGPIIVLVASRSSCDTIIIPHKQPPTNFRLPTNLERLVRLVLALQQAVQKEANSKGTQSELIKALRELWVDIVHPVVQHLGRFAKPGSRIWWCPTLLFNFLPLHAAGEYSPGGTSLSQLYISSYTPSLTALIKARASHDRSLHVTFAAIGQNHPPEHSFPLTCVEPELDLVQSLLPHSPTVSFTKLTSVESTKSTALRTLRDNHWIHLACHGTQNFVEPFKSAFLMRDQPLQLLDIGHTDLSRHEFAFLSACETAVGNFETPDEAIHLAAGLQFSGVKSVVGTLWNVNDSTVQRLVAEFYKNFCGDGKMNPKRAARALHKAVQLLAVDKTIPLDQRIVFMHIGL